MSDIAIRAAIKSTQSQIAELEQLSVARMNKVYREGSKHISARIAAQSGNPSFLRNLQRSLENELYRLNVKVDGEIRNHLTRSARMGVRVSEKTGASIVEILPASFKASKLTPIQFAKVNARVIKSLQTSVSGVTLSERVWRVQEATLRDMRRMIADGFVSGRPRSQIQADIKRFLFTRDADMRTKQWKQFFKENPPGRGVYRSAAKNAERILRTEGMRAMRLSQIEYAKTRTWVAGVRWNLSAAHPRQDICDDFASQDLYDLGAGVYPPDATPDSAHPNCFCYLTPVPKASLLGK